MKFKLLVSLTVLVGSTALLVVNTKLNTVEESNETLEQQVNLYKTLNDEQKDIILKYKEVSGIDVSSITQTLHNEQLMDELEDSISEVEDK